jgi:hypothetical protein
VITIRKNSVRLLVLAALGSVALSFSTAPVLAAGTAPAASNEAKQDWAKQRQEWFKHVTDRMADRLEIKASQQNAWQAYTKALEAATEHAAMKPEIKTDAASIARLHAELAAAHAQKLAQIADATAKLQEVLGPEQRKTLDQMAAHGRGRHGHHFHGGDHGEHDGHEHGQWDQHRQGGFGQDRDHEQHQ